MKKKLFGRLGESINANVFVVALAAMMAFTGFFTYNTVKSIREKRESQRLQDIEQQQPQAEEPSVQTNEDQTGVPVEQPQKTPAPQNATPAPQPEAETQTEEKKPFVLPVEKGRIYARFSGDELVYNRTMDDWRTHNGIDIYAQKGDAVFAGADGTVKEVYEDGMLGWVVAIDHDGFTARYCGLSKNVGVTAGQTVTQGQRIGMVDEVPLEVNDESHLHLEIVKTGKNINPDTLL